MHLVLLKNWNSNHQPWCSNYNTRSTYRPKTQEELAFDQNANMLAITYLKFNNKKNKNFTRFIKIQIPTTIPIINSSRTRIPV